MAMVKLCSFYYISLLRFSRDIKGGNIMLMSNGVIKLIDFGCAKRLYANLSVNQSQVLKSMKGDITVLLAVLLLISVSLMNPDSSLILFHRKLISFYPFKCCNP